ncbi:MAG TPA: NADH-quinone oxidoreductase subunit NuoK [Firmicutes bacterium]|nr:NADH-quinone oxidoreductase subunit NuoK [Bacillota bacterium]
MPLSWVLTTSLTLFGLGLWGVLRSRNAVRILMGIELMINAVNLTLVGFAGAHPGAGNPGPVPALLVMTVAAAEAAIGLAIFLALARHQRGIDIDRVHLLRW